MNMLDNCLYWIVIISEGFYRDLSAMNVEAGNVNEPCTHDMQTDRVSWLSFRSIVVVVSNLGRTNTQGFQINKKKVLPL